MAFPVGWGRRCALVIESDYVDANLTDFPVLLTHENLPSEMFDADGSHPALNGGGDIRFSSDEAGSTQLACEVAQFVTDNNPANGLAQIWVKVASVSGSTDTTIYVWYEKSGESQPSPSDTYGSQSVWTNNFHAVWHNEQDPAGSAPQILDSTATGADGTSGGSMVSGDLVAAQIENGLAFDGSQYIYFGSMGLTRTAGQPITLSAWSEPDSTSTGNHVIIGSRNGSGAGDLCKLQRGSDFHNFEYDPTGSGGNVSTTTAVSGTQYVVGTYDGTNLRIYLNGSQEAISGSLPSAALDQDNWAMATQSDSLGSEGYDGVIDEVRIATVARSAEWIDAEFNNQSDPAAFVVPGTPETPGGGGALTGTGTITFSGDGLLTGSGSLAAAATITFANNGTLDGSGSLVGSATVTFAGAGALTAAGALTGSATVTFGGAGALTGNGTLAGSATITFGGSGEFTDEGALTGSGVIRLTGTGSLTAAGALSAHGSLTFGGSGTFKIEDEATGTGLAQLQMWQDYYRAIEDEELFAVGALIAADAF